MQLGSHTAGSCVPSPAPARWAAPLHPQRPGGAIRCRDGLLVGDPWGCRKSSAGGLGCTLPHREPARGNPVPDSAAKTTIPPAHALAQWRIERIHAQGRCSSGLGSDTPAEPSRLAEKKLFQRHWFFTTAGLASSYGVHWHAPPPESTSNNSWPNNDTVIAHLYTSRIYNTHYITERNSIALAWDSSHLQRSWRDHPEMIRDLVISGVK